MTSTHTLVIPNDLKPPRHQQTIVRYQKADGDWKEVKTNYNLDGSVRWIVTEFAQAGRGVFQIDEARHVLMFISGMPSTRSQITEESLRNDSHFNRTESVFGYVTCVLRYPDADGNGYLESYVAPALQGLPIKMIKADKEASSVIEPVKIEIGEPDRANFSFPDYPVSYDFFQKKIQTTEQAGHPQDAERMRRVLRDQLDKSER